jgi:hypothetical protein
MVFSMIHLHKIRLLVLLFFSVKAAFAFDTITGTVHNETTGKPVAGDEVVLLRIGQGMQEESHAKTDAQGAFALNVASLQAPYLLQVTHQGVTYSQPVKPIRGSTPVDLIVYDAVADVTGLGGTIGAVELASDGKTLRLRQRYEVINKSNPPFTQFKADNFELSIPANAVFDSVLARWKQGMWLKVTANAIKGHSGKYGINFPIRPGENQFDIVYHVPYNGSATLHLNVPYPVDRFGIMHPPSMSFNTENPAAFKTLGPKNNVVVEMAAASPLVGDVPAFEVSGMGVAPEHGTEAPAGPAPAAPAAAAPPGNLHATQNTATTVAEQSGREQWLMIGGIIVLLGVGAFTFWRMTAGRPAVVASASSGATQPLLSGLKEELFQLESDRLHGKISAEEYAATKQALSESIRRAMERKSSS